MFCTTTPNLLSALLTDLRPASLSSSSNPANYFPLLHQIPSLPATSRHSWLIPTLFFSAQHLVQAVVFPRCMYITYLLLHNKRLQNLGACNNDIYYLAVSVGQESRCTQLDPQIHGLSEAAIQVSAEGCDPGVSGGRIPSQDHSRCCWQYSVPAGSIYQRSQSLVGCWWEVTLSYLPHGPL